MIRRTLAVLGLSALVAFFCAAPVTFPPQTCTSTLSVDAETLLVYPNQAATIERIVGLNRVGTQSIEIQSGCALYDFGLFQRATYAPGTAQLLYVGQAFGLYEGNPPVLIDSDGTNKIRAKFWNRSSYPCTFRILVKGVAL